MALELRLAEADAQSFDVQSELEAARLAGAEQAKSRWEELLQREQDVTSRIADLQGRVDARQRSVARADIVAPHDGVVRNIRIQLAGLSVGEGEPLMDIARSNQSFVVEVTADAATLPKIEPGGSAQIWAGSKAGGAAKAIQATVEGISSDDDANLAAEDQKSTRTVYLSIDDSSVPAHQRPKFRAGETVSVKIPHPHALTELRAGTDKRRLWSG
jgi:adhesin transport system membrane fusion protein